MLIPSSNVASEGQIQTILPKGVSLHVSRLELTVTNEDGVRAMTDRVEEGARLLSHANVDLIVFHCTAATTFALGADDDIIARMVNSTGIAATATSKALLAALNELGARRVALITPYIQEINAREAKFLAANGYDVACEVGLGITDTHDMFAVDPLEWFRVVIDNRDANADVYFLSCAAIRSAEVIEALERELDRPVITSNQVAAWHSLRATGISDPVSGFGRLLSDY